MTASETRRPAARDGLLLIDKPPGPTSHDIVGQARRRLGLRRIGHTGTLDPPASGLLPLVVGRATRLARFLDDTPKIYGGTIRLGVRTDTDDMAGEILERLDLAGVEAARVQAAVRALQGPLDQLPPRVSARKVGGQRLYRLARQGVEVEAPPRRIEVFGFELRPTEDPGLWGFHASVSPGTYIRSLARDLGQALGVGGAVERLRRERIADLSVADAIAPQELTRDLGPGGAGWIGLDNLPLRPPALRLAGADEVRRFTSGMALPVDRDPDSELLRSVRDPAGHLLGIGELREQKLHPRVVLPEPDQADRGGLPG